MNNLHKNIVNLYGENGWRWLALLPNLTQKIADVWHLHHLHPALNLSYNYVLMAKQNSNDVVVKFIRNPIKELITYSKVQHIIAKRLDIFAQLLHIDRDVLKKWSYVQTILAACWQVEDCADPNPFLTIAEYIEQA